MPAISVIMPASNAEKYIRESIDSILNQTFEDFEFIIINNASTDSTLSIINSYTDNRIRIANNPVKGLSSSLNMGLDLAKGEFIARMDADDIAHKERFERQIEFFKSHKDIDLCATWVQLFGAENGIHRKYTSHDHMKADLLFLNTICHPSVMFKRESFKKYNLRYDESLILLEDYTLWINAIDRLKFATLPQVLLKYRMHSTNSSVLKAGNKKILDEGHNRIFQFFYQKVNITPTKEELAMHRKMGMTATDLFQEFAVKDYLNLFVKILNANEKTLYFKQQALKHVILSCIVYLFRKDISLKSLKLVAKMLKSAYNWNDYFSFVTEKFLLKSKVEQGF